MISQLLCLLKTWFNLSYHICIMVTEGTIDSIINLFRDYGAAAYDGEPVSQTEHMLQCATLAMNAGCGAEVVISAFLHDIGHLLAQNGERMGDFGMMKHEIIGENFLAANEFPERIAQLVGSHVNAKRYLTARNPDYYDQLSDTSKETLKIQGGPMTAAEAVEFESHPDFKLYIQLRKWDELAKIEKATTISLDDMKELMKIALLD